MGLINVYIHQSPQVNKCLQLGCSLVNMETSGKACIKTAAESHTTTQQNQLLRTMRCDHVLIIHLTLFTSGRLLDFNM